MPTVANSANRVRFGKNGTDQSVTQVELQQDIERFASGFIDQLAEAGAPLEQAPDPALRQAALRQVLVYGSSVLDIATGSIPEVNLLDMMVFVRLSHDALERHWVPKVLGPGGKALTDAFAEGDKQVSGIATKVMNADARAQLDGIIDDWQKRHPDQFRVESVRLSNFSVLEGDLSPEHAAQSAGILGTVRSATRAADAALLFGDRALFLSHRMPFLLRLQARLGTQEIVSDSIDRLSTAGDVFGKAPDVRPILSDLKALTQESRGAAAEARSALLALEPVLAHFPKEGVERTLDSTNRLADKLLSTLVQVNQMIPGDPERAVSVLESRADHFVRRLIGYLVFLGAAWSVFFWGGYYAFKRTTNDGAAPEPKDRHLPKRRGPPAHHST